MEKLKNTINRVKAKTGEAIIKLGDNLKALGENIADKKEIIPVSDLAVDQGAKHEQAKGKMKNVKTPFITLSHDNEPNWIKDCELNVNGREQKANLPVTYRENTGIAPTIDTKLYPQFGVRNGCLTYNGVYVLYPQDRVSEEKRKLLTRLAPEYGKNLGVLNAQRIADERKGAFYATYDYLDHPYCYRIDTSKEGAERRQWYQVSRVPAENKGNFIQCKKVLYAEYYYDEASFVKEVVDFTMSLPIKYFDNLAKEDQLSNKGREI